MQKEIRIRVKEWPFPILNTIYLGGGTPSILQGSQLAALFDTISQNFEIDNSAEISLEANPDDINVENLKLWKSLGINRLSIGLQSSHDFRLIWMNRIHSAEEGRRAVKLSQNMGLENISLDLMYNFPESTDDELLEDIDSLVSLAPKHISAYGLTIEPQTVFGKRQKKGELHALPDEKAAHQFYLVSKQLQSADFEHYEISNFGKAGFYAHHNSNYWFQKPYLAIGPGAHGFDGSLRYENLPNNNLYIKNLLEYSKPYQKAEKLSKEEFANEIILTRLRTKWGISLPDFQSLTDLNLLEYKRKEIEMLENKGLIALENQSIVLSTAGKIFADRIAMDLMF